LSAAQKHERLPFISDFGAADGRWPKREAGMANINLLNPGLESDGA
jgi:hypothetical protein